MGDSSNLWELDRDVGVLVFNTTHPLWVSCDKSDPMICDLQSQVLTHVLALEGIADNGHQLIARLLSDDLIKYYVGLLTMRKSRATADKANKAKDDPADE